MSLEVLYEKIVADVDTAGVIERLRPPDACRDCHKHAHYRVSTDRDAKKPVAALSVANVHRWRWMGNQHR